MSPEFSENMSTLLSLAGSDADRLCQLLIRILSFHQHFNEYRQHVTQETLAEAEQHHRSPYFALLDVVRQKELSRASELQATLIGYIFPESPAQAIPALLLLLQLDPSPPAASAVPIPELSPVDPEQEFKEKIRTLFRQLGLSLLTAQDLTLKLDQIRQDTSQREKVTSLVTHIDSELNTIKRLIERISSIGYELDEALKTKQTDSFTSQRLALTRSIVRELNHSLGNHVATAIMRVYIIGKSLDALNHHIGKDPLEILIHALEVAKTRLQPYVEGETSEKLFENPMSLVIPNEEADLRSVIQQILDHLCQDGTYIPAHLQVKTDFPEFPLPIMVSEVSMASIVTNLLGNAIRHTPDDGTQKTITIRMVSATRPQDKQPFAVLEVIDEGEGIPPEILPYIFNDGFSRRNPGQLAGTGQGLAIVKEAVQRHNGFIVVKSQVGAGTIFRMAFPLLEEKKHLV